MVGGPITPEDFAAALEASKKSAMEKVDRLYAAEIDFHSAAAESIRLARDSVIDFRIEELRGKINAIVEQNQFSIGKFLVDLTFAIAFGPVLGSLMGRAAGNQMNAIIHWRKAIVPLQKLTAQGARRPITKAQDEALRNWAIGGLSRTELPSRAVYRLSDFQTGVMVDSFQAIGGALPTLYRGLGDQLPLLGNVTTTLSNPSQDLTRDIKLDVAAIKYVPTILESISDNADNYLLAQRKTAFEQHKILRVLITVADTGDKLAEIHTHLDDSLKLFADRSATNAVRRQMRNISKMLGLLLFKGNPAGWSGMFAHDPGGEYSDPMNPVVKYDMTWPKELQEAVLNNVWIPGTEESYYYRYLRSKRNMLEREKGEGIDKNGSGWNSPVEPGDSYPRSAAWDTPGNLGNPRYTALQTAFWYFQTFMEQFYKELTSKAYDVQFIAILQRWGYTVTK
jgi:hypothetical protein